MDASHVSFFRANSVFNGADKPRCDPTPFISCFTNRLASIKPFSSTSEMNSSQTSEGSGFGQVVVNWKLARLQATAARRRGL